MLKAEATGPRVPAIMGNAEEANHQRLQMLVKFLGFYQRMRESHLGSK